MGIKSKTKKRRGYTLIELAIAVSVFSLALVFMYKVLFNETRMMNSISQKNNSQYDVNSVMRLIEREFRNNNIVYSGNHNDSKDDIDFFDNSYNVQTIWSGNKRLINIIDSNRNPNNTVHNADLNFYTRDNTLRDVNGVILCNNISIKTFCLDGASKNGSYYDMVTVAFVIMEGDKSYQLTSSFSIINSLNHNN